MRLRGKKVGELTTGDLATLLDNRVSESRERDYKLELPGNSSGAKKDFLADVAALSNTEGGVIIYGIGESKDANNQNTGLPEAIPGIDGLNAGKEELRFTSMLNDGISPGVGGTVKVQAVRSPETSSDVLILGVPRGFAGPYMVTFERTNRFYRRSESGNYLPDVSEIRRMFSERDLWADSADTFRNTRISRLGIPSVTERLYTHSPTFFHILPLGRLDTLIDLSQRYHQVLGHLFPPGHSGANGRFNTDGIMGFQESQGFIRSYTQLFRFGGLEGYSTENVRPAQNNSGVNYLAAKWILTAAMDWFPKGIAFLSATLGVEPPYAIGVSFQGARSAVIFDEDGFSRGDRIDSDDIRLPLTVANDTDLETTKAAVWPMMDMIWQSAGLNAAPRQTRG